MEFARKIFKKLLTFLTKWAIKKHQIEIIAVLGEKHSRLTSYVMWELLRKDYFTRCQWDRSYWDLSIPLTILGYDVGRKSLWEWIKVTLKATWVLLTQSSKSQLIILHIPETLPENIYYWFSLFTPKYIVAFDDDLADSHEKLIESYGQNQEVEIVTIGEDLKVSWLEENDISYDLPGVFWVLPILAASKIALDMNISREEINSSLKTLEPLIFLKVREEIESSNE